MILREMEVSKFRYLLIRKEDNDSWEAIVVPEEYEPLCLNLRQ